MKCVFNRFFNFYSLYEENFGILCGVVFNKGLDFIIDLKKRKVCQEYSS
jgi:hypothetical protein